MPRRNVLFLWIFSILCLFLCVAPFTFAELVNDGSFENNPTAWEEFFNTPCNPTGIGDWSEVNNAPDNFDGQQTLWVGGTCTLIVRNNGASQNFTLQENAAILSFWFNPIKLSPDALGIDRAIVSINDAEVWSLSVDGMTNPTGWNNALIDISQYANQSVTLTLEMQQNNDTRVANVFFDYIEFLNPAITVNQAFVPTAVAPGSSFTVEITVENSGDTTLNNVSVTNSTFSGCNREAGSLPDLAPGENTIVTCEVANASAAMENTATAQAVTTEIEYPVEASQTRTVPIADLQLIISPEAVSVIEGDQVTLALTLTNIGDVALANVQISSAQVGSCTFAANELDAGETAEFTCTFTPNQSSSLSFLATAIDPATSRETSVETAVSIELLPPPNISTSSQFVPFFAFNLMNHNALGEVNNSCDLAYPLTPNQAGQFLAEDVHDWYQFTLNASSNLTVKLNNFVPIAGQITVWRGDCQSLTLIGQNGDFSTTKIISLTNQPPGMYYIWLINDGPINATDKYSLTVSTP
ncbi:MAG: hypothetical protein H6656_09910 [Ardenticatenaceae bacterium]|nr:hypothetical protein [Ardenticatenaceae bacterium]